MESESKAEREIDEEKKKSQEGQQISEEDMRSAFKAVDIDKSGEISKRVRLHITLKKSSISSAFAGAQNGREIPQQTIWSQGRKKLDKIMDC